MDHTIWQTRGAMTHTPCNNIAAQRVVSGGHDEDVVGHRPPSVAEIAELCDLPSAKKSQSLAILGVSLKIIKAGSSQRPRPQVGAAARFRGRSDHGTRRSLASICLMAPSSKVLDLLPQAPLPPVQKRDAQHKFFARQWSTHRDFWGTEVQENSV